MLLRTLVRSHYKHIFRIHSLCLVRSPFAVFLTSVHCWHWWFTANACVFAEIQFVNIRHDTRVMVKSTKKSTQAIKTWSDAKRMCATNRYDVDLSGSHKCTHTIYLKRSLKGTHHKNRYYSSKYKFSTMRLYLNRILWA